MAPLPALVALLGAAVLTGSALVAAAAPIGTGWSGGPGGVTGAVTSRADPRPPVTAPAPEHPAGSPPGPAGVGAASPGLGTHGERSVPFGSGLGFGMGLGSGSGSGFGWPVAGAARVLRGFAPGPYPWSPGHRGVDLVGSGPQVLAPGAGIVGFAGVVAGQGVLVLRHTGGLRTTYQPVAALVPVGRTVSPGEPIGMLAPDGTHCPGIPCLHWGALVGDRYLDPLSLLSERRRPPVLLPLDGIR